MSDWRKIARRKHGCEWTALVDRWRKQHIGFAIIARRLGVSTDTLRYHWQQHVRQLQVEKDQIVAEQEREGRALFFAGGTESACPHGMGQLMQRCAWLAGYRDAERGMV